MKRCRLSIAVLSDRESSGGANIAAHRLTEGFAAAGHQVTRIYQQAAIDDPRFETRLIRSKFATHELPLPARLAWKVVPHTLHQRLHDRSSEGQLAAILKEVRPDVITVHNLHIGRWSPEMIRVCAAHAPVLCKLCDTWTFTGRCYNPGSCDKYLTACDATCPTADEYPALKPSRIRAAFELRRSILDQCTNVAAVAPSQWIGRLASAGLWKHRAVFRIPNGIDLNRYAPMDRVEARLALGLGPEGPVLLCGAALLSERKKGAHLLIDALARGLSMPVRLLLFGVPVELPPLANVEMHTMGYVDDDTLKAVMYNSADVYIHPSLADNSPNTVIEALSCGTPVVAYPVDGVPEMVIPGQTGWLTSDVSADALHRAVSTAVEEVRQGLTLRQSCRRFAQAHYDMTLVVRQYERIFCELASGREIPAGLRIVA